MKTNNGKITKAIITCGGYSSRFAPISRAVPKEMLPIGDRPAIHYIIEELKLAGVRDILLLIGRGREALVNYIDLNYEFDVEKSRRKKATDGLYNIELKPPFDDLNIYFRRVPMPRGAADAIYHAKAFIGDDPFIVAYSDDVFLNGNPTAELINQFQDNGKTQGIISACSVDIADVSKYGILNMHADGMFPDTRLKKIIEKPQTAEFGNLAACGRYLFTPQIFEIIDRHLVENSDKPGETACMTEVINELCHAYPVYVAQTNGSRFDCGHPYGLYLANQYYFNTAMPDNMLK